MYDGETFELALFALGLDGFVMSRLSAYIPCYNNRATLGEAIESLRRQTLSVDDLWVVDDGSADGSAELAASLGVKVVSQQRNLGRGAARARGMEAAQHDWVLCCDATNVLPETFAAEASRWLEEANVAAVFGGISQYPGGDAATRWRGRYLFRMPKPGSPPPLVNRRGCLSTYGAIVRRSAVIAAGNYDVRLRHSEDAELGQRLLDKGWDVIQDPSLKAISLAKNSLGQVMERYWRWNAGTTEMITWGGYAKLVSYSAKAMAADDLREGDLGRALISLYCPHYQFWRSWWRRRQNRVQR